MSRTGRQIKYMISEWILVVATQWEDMNSAGNPNCGVYKTNFDIIDLKNWKYDNIEDYGEHYSLNQVTKHWSPDYKLKKREIKILIERMKTKNGLPENIRKIIYDKYQEVRDINIFELSSYLE
jgi:hypothetical protein